MQGEAPYPDIRKLWREFAEFKSRIEARISKLEEALRSVEAEEGTAPSREEMEGAVQRAVRKGIRAHFLDEILNDARSVGRLKASSCEHAGLDEEGRPACCAVFLLKFREGGGVEADYLRPGGFFCALCPLFERREKPVGRIEDLPRIYLPKAEP